MTRYNVHIYRELRLVFAGIEAGSPEEAAARARDLDTAEADEIDDCEGETFAAAGRAPAAGGVGRCARRPSVRAGWRLPALRAGIP